MAKVTVLIEPEDQYEGDYGHTTMASRTGVVSLDQLVDIYRYAANGAGWEVDGVGVVTKSGFEFWGET